MGPVELGQRTERPDRRPTGHSNDATDRRDARVSVRLTSNLDNGKEESQMAAAQKDPVLVVVQLTGGNDYLNTVIPYNNTLYQDNRKAVGIPESQILAIDNEYGLPQYMAPMKKIWDEGKLAIMHGVGYLDSPRSHFRSMDIWHTCEAEKVGTEGWLGRVVREFDPKKENVVTAVSFGPCLFRALAVPG